MAYIKPTILIIEDEEVLLAAITEKLKLSGYIVIGAKDGEAGLNFIKEKKPDLILLDILLPKKNGFDILADINKDKELAKIPVIVISNSGQPVEIKKLFELGIKDYLVKAEFDPEEVLEKIEKVLGPRPARFVNHSDTEVPPTLAEKEYAGLNKNNETVLVIEDDRFLRDLLVEKLNKEGFSVKEAIDGNEALKQLEKVRPNLILLDLILPGIDGFEILKRMKDNPELSKIPVIVLSNLGQEEDINRAKELGAIDYLIKAHFTLGEIIEKIRTVFRENYF